MRLTVFASILSLTLSASVLSAEAAKAAPAAGDTQTVSGACSPGSKITSGGLNAGPGDHTTKFACDTAVVTFKDAKRQHVVLEFSLGGKKDSTVVGFDGAMGFVDGGLAEASVQQIYVVRGGLKPADEGKCFISFSGRALTAAQCFASTHQNNNRSGATISFKAKGH